MQSSLHDLSSTRHSQSFTICQRVLHKCHEIIFNDLPHPITSPYPSSKLSAYIPFSRKKVRHHVEPALVGIGVVLAATPGMPALADFTGQIAIEQGRADDDGRELRSLQMIETDVAPPPKAIEPVGVDDDADDIDSPRVEESGGSSSPAFLGQTDNQEGVRPGAPLARRRTIAAAQTVPALPLHLHSIRRSRASEDPLGQLDPELPPVPHQSSPSLSALKTPPRSAAPNAADALLEKYDVRAQTLLLRGHYCHSEVRPYNLLSTELTTINRSNLSWISRTSVIASSLSQNLPA